MSVKSYINFDLLLDSKGDNTYQVRVVDSPAGQATSTITMPFSQVEIENFILKVGQNRGNVRSIDVLNIDKASVPKFGGDLYSSFFADDIADCFRSSYAIAKHTDRGLRIRLLQSS